MVFLMVNQNLNVRCQVTISLSEIQSLSCKQGLCHGKRNINSIRYYFCVLVCNTLSTFYSRMIKILALKLQYGSD